MSDLAELLTQQTIQPTLVLHVGYADNNTIRNYHSLNAEGVLFLATEADRFEGLQKAIAASGADRETMVAIQVPLGGSNYVATLDSVLENLDITPSDFNILTIQLPGEDYLILRGAVQLLQYIDVVVLVSDSSQSEIDVYQQELDQQQVATYLEKIDFQRSPFVLNSTNTNGREIAYVKTPVITMSTLGVNGRFANQLFQYAFLRIYAQKCQLRLETSPWIGQYLFGHNDPPVTKPLPVVGSPENPLTELAESLLENNSYPYKNVDFWGYFQYHTRFYAPYQSLVRSLFKPMPLLENWLQIAVDELRDRGKTIVGLHLRRGDFGYGYFFIAPTEWYLAWLSEIWPTLTDPVLFIASDEIDTVIHDFSDYNPITVNDLPVEVPEAPFYLDFYLLSQCDVLAISNSSFSFAAALLNDRATQFMRPHLRSKQLISFSPWNSEPLLKDND